MADLRASGETATLFKQVLKQDLERSGWFETRDDRSGLFQIVGTASSSGTALNTNLRIAWSGGSFVWTESSQSQRDARWQAHRLSDEIVKRVKGVDGMAATRIAFVGKNNGRGGGICICDSDGFGLQQFPSEAISPLSPYFDPTGNFIFYTSFAKGYPCVFRVPAGGGQRSPYASFVGLNTGGAVSPDGKYIAIILSHVGNPELYVLSLANRQVHRQTYTKNGSEASPCWSPDCKRIAYVSDQGGTPQVYIVDSDTHQSRRISYRGSQNVAPSWGPDGRIAYCTRQSGYQIAVYDPRTGHEEVVSSGPDHEDPSWAPDGRHIICSRKDGSTSSLCIIDTKDKSEVKLPLRPGIWRAPDWSRPLR
ncbi:MAG: PD40 domain-containing protein [Kiritimatiellae bacterium]|nr:PD40 domain-containing protein [Kiritimatiellia bacterium]